MSGIPLLLPVKRLGEAKRRLAALMSPSDRQQLVLAMLADVIDAAGVAGLQPIVLSRDGDVLDLARGAGASSLREPSREGGLNGALGWALEELAGAPAALILLPDTPLVSPSELEELASDTPACRPSEAGGTRVVAVPDLAGRGTNALVLRPPFSFQLAFGPGSLARHRLAARSSGATFCVRQLPGIALDLDSAEDVVAFLRQPRETRTRRLLAGLQILLPGQTTEGVRSLPSSARTPRISGANSPTER